MRWRLLTILTTSYGAGAFGMLGISPLSPSLVESLGREWGPGGGAPSRNTLTRFPRPALCGATRLVARLFDDPQKTRLREGAPPPGPHSLA